jgi:hypothetical protein
LSVLSLTVSRFGSTGAFIPPPFSPGGSKQGGIAVNGEGNTVLVEGFDAPEELSGAGTKVGRLLKPPTQGEGASVAVAADQLHNDFYVGLEGTSIADISPQCDPSNAVCSPTQLFGEGDLENAAGLAVDSATGTVYAANAATDQILPFPVAVEAVPQAGTGVTATTATLNAKVDAEGSQLTHCVFEYGQGSAEAQGSVPCVETVTGTSGVSVHADVTGLAGQATYRFRLHATNANGDITSEEEEFTTESLQTIEEARASEVTATSANLEARLNPHGLAVGSCEFQWGTSTAYGNSLPCQPSSLGSGTSPVAISAVLEGLQPGTTYHFRVLASSLHGTAASPDHTFLFPTGPDVETGCPNEALRQANGSTELPDCRAFELVTPARKNGALIGALLLGQVSPAISEDGGRVTAPSIQCFEGTPSCTAARKSEGEPYQFTRASGTWKTLPLAPPAAEFSTGSWWSFGAHAGVGLFSFETPPDGQEEFYVRESDGSFNQVGPVGVTIGRVTETPILTSDDLSRFVYGTTSPVSSFGDEGNSGANSLYEYVGTENTMPKLVGVSSGTSLISACGTGVANDPGAPPIASTFNPVSADGRVVYFTARKCATGTGANAGRAVPADELYERIDEARTVQVSTGTQSGCTTSGCKGASPSAAAFEGASTDGSAVIFTSTQQLTDEASQDSTGSDSAESCASNSLSASGCNLYESECPNDCAEPSGRKLIDVSAGARETGGPKVQGVVALSPDGSHIYFVAKGALTDEPDQQGQTAQGGADNLYLYERDGAQPGGRLTFIAALAPSDAKTNWLGGAGQQGLGTANTTPDGRYLVLTSHRGLTPDARHGEGPAQVYRYDAVTEVMTRISIGQRGFADDGNAASSDATIAPAHFAFDRGDGPAYANPTLSDDGRYVFFESPTALAPGALNNVQVETSQADGSPVPVYAENVYEWEADGTTVDGRVACEEPSGCVFLLTDGREVIEGGIILGGAINATPQLLGTDATGENVFIAAADRLTWQDTDSQRDYYDLRVNGGFAPPAEPAICQGDACKGPATQRGPIQSLSTSTFGGPPEGPKSPGEAACKNGFVKKGGKCVKRLAHRSKHHKKKRGKKQKRAGSRRGGQK